MWGVNSTTYNGLGFDETCICHTATVPCLCTNPMTTWSSLLLNSNNILNYQRAPENDFSQASNPPFYLENGQEASDQMARNELDSWLMSDNDTDQFFQMQTQGIQASLLPMVADVAPEATIGTTMDLPQQWPLNQFSFSSFYPGNQMIESVGNYYSNSTNISSVGSQLLTSRDDLQKPNEFPPMSRQARILRYLEKKKKRKYEPKMICSSRKTFAKTRPRIRGRFARISQTDAQTMESSSRLD